MSRIEETEEVVEQQLFSGRIAIFKQAQEVLTAEPPDYEALVKLFHWCQGSETVAQIFKTALVVRPEDHMVLLNRAISNCQVHSAAFQFGVATAYFQAAVYQDARGIFPNIFQKYLHPWLWTILKNLGSQRVAPAWLKTERKTLGPIVKKFLGATALKESLLSRFSAPSSNAGAAEVVAAARKERLTTLCEIIADQYEEDREGQRFGILDVRELVGSEIRFAIFSVLNPQQQSRAISLWYRSCIGEDGDDLKG